MCIKPLINIVLENLDTIISSPHLDSLNIYALVLDD
jgi:hypothetical protein